jgi:hypothetical protein
MGNIVGQRRGDCMGAEGRGAQQQSSDELQVISNEGVLAGILWVSDVWSWVWLKMM